MTDFTSAYARHVHHFLAQLGTDDALAAADVAAAVDDPERFGPGYVTDLCRCGHERGSHWDGEGTCDPATCGCRDFRDWQS
jgi:hypothetical protein